MGVGWTQNNQDESVLALGLFIDAAIGDRVRFHLGYNQQLSSGVEMQTGAESVFTGLGAVLVDSSVQLRGEVAAWWPAGPADDNVILAPAFDLGIPLGADKQLLIRTRQGALIDLTTDGPMVWASAYGLDVRGGPLSFGIELDSSIGKDLLTDELITSLAAALVVSADAGPVTLGLTAQRAITRDFERARGPWRAQLTFGLDLDRVGQ